MFEKIFSIIREEGYSDGGVVVQVKNCLLVLCLKLAANFFFFNFHINVLGI